MTLGITFGGGAAKGAAHIGAIKCFQENGIDFDVVTGNSAGSIAGALYSYGYTWRNMLKFVQAATKRKSIWFKYGFLYNSSSIESIVEKGIGRINFSDLHKPFCCVACNLRTGKLVVLNSGKVAKAVRASCSIPGIFKPTPIDDMLLVDGCIVNSIPSNICRNMGADYVVTVDLNSDRRKGTDSDSFVECLLTSFHIMVGSNARLGITNSDCVISLDLTGYAYHKLERIEELVELGEKAAYEKLPQIKEAMKAYKSED